MEHQSRVRPSVRLSVPSCVYTQTDSPEVSTCLPVPHRHGAYIQTHSPGGGSTDAAGVYASVCLWYEDRHRFAVIASARADLCVSKLLFNYGN